MQEGEGEMWEFDSTVSGRRTRWPKRRSIKGREQEGDARLGGVSLAGRLVSLWTSFVDDGISRIVGERKRGKNRAGQDKCRAGKGWAASRALRRKKRKE
jgi:hypothetical protein